MDEQIKELLGGEIESEIENLSTFEPGSEEHSKAVENLAKLYRLKIDEAKNEWDYAVKYESQESDAKLKRMQIEEQAKDRELKQIQMESDAKLKQMQIEEQAKDRKLKQIQMEEQAKDRELKQIQIEEQAKDRYFKLGIEAAGIVLPLMFYASWMRKGFKFEETGAFTSGTFRNLFSHFRPTKR